jgi:iron(III) transport system permease protein
MSRLAVPAVPAGLALLAVPLLFPLAELARRPTGVSALHEAPRVASLLQNTLALGAGAVLLAVPAGTAAAVLSARGPAPGRAALRGLVLLGVFVPLPVYAAGWQAAFGALGLPDSGGWRPWRTGLLPTIWVHAAAGLPWVAGFVLLSLRTTNPRLEDDARLTGGGRAVWRGVLWPRVRVAALAGAAWVVVQALTESSATDVFMVRTFAEEVYFQLVGNPAGVSAAVAVTLPVWLAAGGFAVLTLGRAAANHMGTEIRSAPAARGLSVPAAAVWLGAAVLVGVPVVSLALRAGSVGQLLQVARAHGTTLAESGLWAAVAGLLAAALALAACWWSRDSGRRSVALLVLAAFAWVTPAPLAGLGLNTLVRRLVLLEDAVLGADAVFAPVRSMLYDQPSPLPGVWVAVVRFFPVAVVVLWPAVRRVPRELIDAATLDGGRRAVRRAALWPCVRRSFGAAAAAVGLLALGEVVATKLVQPPGRRTFVGDLFDAMHYGADATVAAMCLLQIGVTAGLCAIFATRARSG